MEIHVFLVLKNVDFWGKCECRSAKSKHTIAIEALTREFLTPWTYKRSVETPIPKRHC